MWGEREGQMSSVLCRSKNMFCRDVFKAGLRLIDVPFLDLALFSDWVSPLVGTGFL